MERGKWELGENQTSRILVTGDPLAKMVPEFDTTILIIQELIRRGYEVDYCDLSQMDWHLNSDRYLSHLRVQKVLGAHPSISVDEIEYRTIDEYSGIFHRKDPPVDTAYGGFCNQFNQAPKEIVQVNHPRLLAQYSEHLLPQRYPRLSIPTELISTSEDFIRAIRKNPGESVAKPLSMCSGIGIAFFFKEVQEKVLRDYWSEWGPEIVVQPYMKEIEVIGDLRILVMNSKIIGSVLRRPAPGKRLANLHQGGTATHYESTSIQKAAAIEIAQDLAGEGLYLLGIDFIGDRVSEINITSPSALPQINQLMGIHGEEIIIDEFETLAKSSLSGS